jgi:hypothetical protein
MAAQSRKKPALQRLFGRIRGAMIEIAAHRAPDVVIGGPDDPYLRRWHLIPRNPVLNIYLHQFLRPDDDRALHDHPWPWASWLLIGEYCEHTIKAGGIHLRTWRRAGSLRVSSPWRAHRIELQQAAGLNLICWTLFITGPRIREWGFHCPHAGWVHWRDFTDSADPGRVGRGCYQGDGT